MSSSSGDTSPLRWLIGRELKRHREHVGFTAAALAEIVGMTKAKVANLEVGRQSQTPADIASLLTACAVPRDEIDRLVALSERTQEAVWWTGATHIPEWFKIYAGLERIAARAFVFEPTIVPGLLQTEEYAREVNATSLLVSKANVATAVQVRLTRAARLTSENPLELHAVITEGALRLGVGSKETQQAQLAHLVKMSERPNITVQVLLPEAGFHDAHSGRFYILGFDEVRSIGYTETIQGAVYLQDPDQVAACMLVGDDLATRALDPNDSRELISSMLA